MILERCFAPSTVSDCGERSCCWIVSVWLEDGNLGWKDKLSQD